MENIPSTPKLFSLNKWVEEIGVTPTTAWRWRKRGILKTVNIYGRLYITEEDISEFNRRARAGEFAMESGPAKRLGTNGKHQTSGGALS